MTGQTVTADAQWALHGAVSDGDESRVLACSTGTLSAPNFHDAISRFDPDATHALPQVTVSYLTPAAQRGESLLAMAIHARRRDDGDGGDDGDDGDDGRHSVVTSYFCLPYHRLASAAITYRGMHEALRAIRLPAESGPPLPVTMSDAGPGAPAVDDLALHSAALLLTGRPVCVLDADEVSLDDRLAFIDTVLALLPYGLRARMSAATWTTAAYRDQRFRLYFSDNARAADPPDHVLRWGRPGLQTRIDDDAARYLNWLEGTVSQPTAKLAELTEPIRFTPPSILQMLDAIGVASQDNPSLNFSATGQDFLHPAPTPPTGVGPADGASVLRTFAELAEKGDSRAIKSDIGKLMRLSGAGDEQKRRYREIIKETKLLTRTEGLGRTAAKLHEHLLRVAFTVPLSYEGYVQIEDCLDGTPFRTALHQVIEGVGMADPWVKAIVYWSQRNLKGRTLRESGRQKLNRWYGSGEVDAVEFIHCLSAEWKRPEHARIICDVIVDFLDVQPKGYQPDSLRAALYQHGFLAHALQANRVGNATSRAKTLRRFLFAAYPDGLDQQAIAAILAGDHAPPTASLLAAVLMLAKPGDVPLAPPAYLRGSIRAMDLNEQTRGILKPLLPPPLPLPISSGRFPEGGHG